MSKLYLKKTILLTAVAAAFFAAPVLAVINPGTRTFPAQTIQSQVCEDPVGCSGYCQCDSNSDAGTENKFKFDIYRNGDYELERWIAGDNGLATIFLRVDIDKHACEIRKTKGIQQEWGKQDYNNVCRFVSIGGTGGGCCCKMESGGAAGSDLTSGGATQSTAKKTCKIIFPITSENPPSGSATNECDAGLFGNNVSEPGVGYQRFPLPQSGMCEDLSTKPSAPNVKATGAAVSNPKTPEELLNAASDLNKLSPGLLGSSGEVTVQLFIGRVIAIMLEFIGSIALILYIYAGVLWLISAGNTERVESAKKILIWVTLGLAVMLSSYLIITAVFEIIK